MLAGNHDIPNTKGRANAIEIFGALSGDNLRVFDQPGLAVVETKNGSRVQIAAMPYLIKSLVLSREENKDKGVQETTQLIVDRYTAGIDCSRRAVRPGPADDADGPLLRRQRQTQRQPGRLPDQ